MNVIFLPANRVIHTPTFNSTGNGFTFNSQYENIDAAAGLEEFSHFWDQIDSLGPASNNFIMCAIYELRDKFWDRFEFINLLKANCSYDVYIKEEYSLLKLIFLSNDDRLNVIDKMQKRPPLEYLAFTSDLKPVIQQWIRDNSVEEYRMVAQSGSTLAGIRVFFRDEHFRTLARVKFTNTKPEDHAEYELEDDVPF